MVQAIREQIPPHLRPQQGEAHMFESTLLERLSKVHPALVVAIYLPLLLVAAYYGWRQGIDGWRFVALLLSGIAFWTLFEYLFHRFVFHFSPHTQWAYRLQFIMHGVHHQYPQDKRRLVMPVSVSLLITGALWLLFYALLGDGAFVFFAGFIVGYLCYDMTHYSIHHFPIPGNPMGRALWVNHLRHHYKDPERSFGVSSPIWDHVFRTQATQ